MKYTNTIASSGSLSPVFYELANWLFRHACLKLVFSVLLLSCLVESGIAGAVRPGFDSDAFYANDDSSSDQIPLGFSFNFFGTTYTQIYINNNGNVTFDGPLHAYTPDTFFNIASKIIAPFWADVDTRGAGVVTYGQGSVNGRPAFGVTWSNVGYFNSETDKTNTFQLIIYQADTCYPDGVCYLELNYDSVQWEAGDASNGNDGLGGSSARAGYSDGTSATYELAGSAVNGSFLDTNTLTGLIYNRTSTNEPFGRYKFFVSTPLVCSPAAPTNLNASVTGRTVTLTWDQVSCASNYVVERAEDAGPFTSIGSVLDSVQPSFIDDGSGFHPLVGGKTYVYRVSAVDACGQVFAPSSPVSLTYPAPTVLVGGAFSGNNFYFSITGPDKPMDIQASQDLVTWTTIGSATLEGGTNTFVDTNAALLWGHRYYRVTTSP